MSCCQVQDEHRLPKLWNTALKQQLVVLDELGFIPFSTTGAHLIFQFCATLYDHVTLVVTTNCASLTGLRFSGMNA